MMKTGTKKVLYTFIAVVSALGLGIGAVLVSMLNVQASTEMMPGIEQILDEKTGETPFRILELVNSSSDAEIGYYISGQEPYLTQYTYTQNTTDGSAGESQTFSSVEEGLSVLPTKEERQKFVEASDTDQVKNPLDFSWNADSPGPGSEADYPLSFKSYAEKYFLSKTDDSTKWNRVDFKQSRKETLTGHYEENASGKGDYTKEEQKYYPIREDVKSDGSTTQKYRENISSFFYSDDTEAMAPYQISFEEVKNADINAALKDDNDTTIADAYDYSKGGFGYYENVYGELTSRIAEDIAKKKYTFPGENPAVADGETDSSDTSAGTQANPNIYRGENIEEYPYYKYTLVGDLETVKQKADENKGTTQHNDGDITLEDGQYWYWTKESSENREDTDPQDIDVQDADAQDTDTQDADVVGEADTVSEKKEALYIVTGRQAVAKSQLKEIPEQISYNYYYKVARVDYCCKLSESGKENDPEAYTCYGWYYAAHPSNEDTYIAVEEDADNSTENTDGTGSSLAAILNYTATHYISAAQYTLTSGKGSYDFVEGNGAKDTEQQVELDHLFYQGGYTNHDWFKRYVFHLAPDSTDQTIQQQFKNLSIKVDTKVINKNETEEGTDALPDFDDYDLIYINGRLSKTQAEKIAATTKLPAIINQKTAMGTDADKTAIAKAFAAYIDENYTINDSYVSERIFFINDNICNRDFRTQFKDTQLDQFSEITDYIKSENNYREVVESGENGEKTDPLSTEISQARVIEYILNYKYKRQTPYKSTINVLDIEPASATASITESNVKNWLGQYGEEERVRGTIKEYCCQERKTDGTNAGEGANGGIDKILDGDKNTYWHSKYSGGIGEQPHWFEYQLSEKDSVRNLKGVRFIARSQGYGNGKPYQLKFEMYSINGTKLASENVTLCDDASKMNTWKEKEITFSKVIKNVSYIKVFFNDCYSDKWGDNGHSTKFATCAEFSTLYADNTDSAVKDTKVNITHMTSSEFVGHIDDINTKYDAIYFGDSYNNWDFLRNGDVDDNNKKTSLYAHTGGVFGGDKEKVLGNNVEYHRRLNSRLMGLLDIDYTIYNGVKYLRSPNNTNGEIGKKIGRMRGSGNDITKQQVSALEDFVSSGYPVIIGDGLLNDDKTVNTNVVDSSSYMYEFLTNAIDKAKARTNVMSKTEADKKENLNFFFYLAKPEITFSANGIPPEPQRLNDSSYKYNKEAGTGLIPQTEDGLTYKFTIKNSSEISTANASYDCKLFLDLNFDGNLSSKEEQTEYIQIQDAAGNVIRKQNGKYHLKIGKEYVLTRKIPKDYYKVITWKLEISNNENSSIRTSRTGFTKREAGTKQKINVLQIYPKSNRNDAPVTWRLDQDTDFKEKLAQVTDFDIQITAMQTRMYETKFKEYKKQGKNLLDKYQMIIIGFADGFGVDNISNENGEVDAIRKFIADGKSVLFSHDTTSFINTAKGISRKNMYNENTGSPSDDIPNSWDWGYSLNTYLRASVGMDRYGITSDEKIAWNGENSTVSKELKKGNDLTSGDGIFEAVKSKVSDMAYFFGNKKKSSLMTQGFSNNTFDNTGHTTSHASKVNEGAITQYPYYISDDITTATTHSQYYQLALEQDEDKDGSNDIVVWYCLSKKQNGEDASYQNSPNDVRNNYYFYSKGNVIYTGVGHLSGITDTERNLFANAVIAAANVTAVDPEATFLDDFDPVAVQEEYRYYMPDRLKASEAGDTSNILDGDNTFCIRIRDYNMVASNLSNTDSNANSLTMELYIEDNKNGKEMNINGESVKVSKISVSGKADILKKYSDGQTITADQKGQFQLQGNDTFQFSLNDMESYLKRINTTYKKECRIFAKVDSTVTLYGVTANKETWTSVSLKPRQLFDLD
ncbi:DUF5057 domain-containing protein [Anaerobutyricum soehngenii]|uniref:DUF5057 domain-containing protein n=1 Tax=Anaerobutyricum soehngenii TaxID=105843 RepID=UPI001C1043F7|nr:DUF5057 domain-containing protein [Anaerobutyricum soehngenii]MBU5416217.1 DUF5057 domain-containing protein [Anaerobutyricum soehngenii]